MPDERSKRVAKKKADYYRSLPYTRRVRLESDGEEEYFVAYVVELDGVEADGSSPTEALYHLQGAFEDFLAAMVEWDAEIPEPMPWPGVLGWTESHTAVPRGSVTLERILSEKSLDAPLMGTAPRWTERTGARETAGV